jgi:predicted nucleic acid-binding protein
VIGYLLDTCVISDGRKPQHYPKLAAWLATVDPEESYTSVVTIAKIEFGIARHPSEDQRRMLGWWLTEIVSAFGDQRLLGIEHNVALQWVRRGMSLSAPARHIRPSMP